MPPQTIDFTEDFAQQTEATTEIPVITEEQKSRLKFQNAVDVVTSWFNGIGINREHIFVVGSGALLMLGMPFEKEPEDIDLYVECSADHQRIMNATAKSQKGGTYSNYPNQPNLYIFRIGDFKVNVWAVKKYKEDYLTTNNGTNYALVMPVLEKKFGLKRYKDSCYFSFLINKLSKLFL